MDSKLIEVASYQWRVDADCIVIALESEGISAVLQNEGITSMNPMLSNAVGGIKVFVKEQDLEKATQIVQEEDKNIRDNISKWCPYCESTEIEELKFNKWMLGLSVLTLGFWFVAAYKPYLCSNCGKKFK